MRKEQKTMEGTYSACSKEGSFTPLAKIDFEQIKAMVKVALADYDSLQKWAEQGSKQSQQWSAIFKIAYDVLHTLSEAFLIFDKVKARTHECVFAYLCEKHMELELNWEFLDTVRLLRNRSHYYGKLITYENWKAIEMQLNLSISMLHKEIEKRLKS